MRAGGVPSRSGLFVSVVALAAALVLGVAPSAQAANIVLNPGFEDICGPIPCHWQGSPGSFPASDTINHHSGLASFLITATQPESSTTAVSDCVSVTAGTTYNLLLFYRTTSSRITQIIFGPLYWSNADCTGSGNAGGGNAFTNSAVTDGNWHSVSGTTTALTNPPFNAQSAQLLIHFGCSSGCQATDSANYDDAVMDTNPLAVSVAALSARRSAKGVMIRWRTGSEVDTLGFNVYRQRGARRVRLNRHVIPALSLTRGGISGGRYSFLDRKAPRHARLRYWLQEVDASSHCTWHGPVRLGPA